MIASIHGEILEKSADSVVVEAGGIGYLVQVSRQTLQMVPAMGEPCRLWTYFHVREDRQQLFGFSQVAERHAFELLLTVKGVGPRLALAILSELNPAGLREALLGGQTARLNKLPGVGQRLAERLAVELKNKAQELDGGGDAASPGLDLGIGNSGDEDKAMAALQSLGFGQAQSRLALQAARQAMGADECGAEELVKTALKLI